MPNEVLQILEKVEKSFEGFKASHEENVASLLTRVEGLEAKRNGPGPANTDSLANDEIECGINLKSGAKIPLLKSSQSVVSVTPQKTHMSFGRYLRALITGTNGVADDSKQLQDELKSLATTSGASGGYDVPVALSAQFIDLLRNRLVLNSAGVTTVPMTTQTLNFAKLLSDPIVGWHAEGAGDISASDPTFGQASLTAKTVVVLTKFSVELGQDALNLESILANSLAQAVAQAVDQAGLGSTISNAPSGIMSFSGRNRIQNIGAPTSYDPFVDGMGALLRANVPQEKVGPIVVGSDVWTELAKLKTGLSGDKTALRIPPALEKLPFLVSNGTAIGAGSPSTHVGYMAKWDDLFFGIRQDIRIQFLREVFMGSNLQIGVIAYLRCDFVAARQSSFVTLEDFV